jgi:hypothetical protein
MRNFVTASLAASLLSVCAGSFAQPQLGTAPVSRAQVQKELVDLERAGYDPRNSTAYPDNIQAAQKSVAAEQARQDNARKRAPNQDAGSM